MTGCGCPTRVTTWADGHGRWHAAVPDTDDGARVAAEAIRVELEARGDAGPGHVVEVTAGPLVGPADCHPRREYVESD